MDFSNRYPETIPLKGISTAEVTEAMIGLFVRIGIPKIMHSDNGKRFKSAEMKEICNCSVWIIHLVLHIISYQIVWSNE